MINAILKLGHQTIIVILVDSLRITCGPLYSKTYLTHIEMPYYRMIISKLNVSNLNIH